MVEAVTVDDPREGMGINDRRQLARGRAVMRRRILDRLMLEGVTVLDPATTYVDDTVEIGAGHRALARRDPRGAHGHRRRVPSIGAGSLVIGTAGSATASTSQPYCVLERSHGGGRRRSSARSATCARCRAVGAGAQDRQLRRDEEVAHRPRRQGAASVLRGRRDDRARTSTSAPAPSPATTTASRSTRRSSGPARSSAPTRASWRRSRSATAPTSAPAPSSPRTCPRGARRLARAADDAWRAGWPPRARKPRERKHAGRRVTCAASSGYIGDKDRGRRPPRWAAAPRVPRLRLGGRRRHRSTADCRSAARPGGSRSCERRPARAAASTAPSASATRAGRPTAARPTRTPIPTPTARATSSSCTTASSRTTCELKARARGRGPPFTSETDTEVVAHLSSAHQDDAARLAEARPRARSGELAGPTRSWCSPTDEPDRLVAAKRGAGAVVVGLGEDETFVASDIPAILAHTRDVIFLEDGEIAVVDPAGVDDLDARRRPRRASADADHLGPGHGGEGRLSRTSC